MNLLLATVVLLPLLLGTVLCGCLGGFKSRPQAPALAAALITAAVFGLLLSAAPEVLQGQVLLSHVDWVPAIGMNLGLRLDGLSLLFAGLITGIGLLIIVYAAFYLSADDPKGKFYSQLMLFMAAMLGIALSDNLLLLVVFWELTSISSFLLVGYWGHKEEARQGARMALAVTGGGGLVLLAGVIVLGQICGSYDLGQMLTQRDLVQADPRYPLALGLILVGAFSKSAQVPFHFWLPEAMAAPTPVSAYLHSATMVKAGLFLLARLYPVLGGTALFEGVVASVGLATMVFAAFVAIFKHDLKGLLAYSTISHLGFITFMIGLGTPMSAVVAVFHVLNHACFKAALFMTAGIVDHETGTRDMRRLGGLMKLMPWVGSLGLLAAAAMAGVPPFNGFLSKELMLEQALLAGFWGSLSWAIPLLATLGGLCSVAYSLRLVHDVFFNGPARELPQAHPHEPPWGMKLPVLVLVALCIAIGLAPMWLAAPLVQAAAGAMLGEPAPAFQFALWHGLNLPLLMSVIAVAGGALLYFGLMSGGRLHRYLPGPLSGKAMFHATIDGLFGLAGRCTRRLENGSLQRYAAWMVATAIALSAWPLLRSEGLTSGSRELLAAPPLAIGVWLLLIVMGLALVLMHRQRFVAVILAGGVGLVCSMAFLALSAPDLALTQLSVDVVSTALLLMGLALLPQVGKVESSSLRRGRDALLALLGGGGMAWLSWLMLTRNHESISWYFLENALSGGGGANVVNVILVDFRGYDTFGEITVLGIAAVGVLALLDGFRVKRPKTDGAGRAWSYAREPLMLRVVARLVLPLALMASAYIYWRGHNLPGGGFIAGLVTGVALVLQYMANGQQRAEALMHAQGGRRYVRWIGTGLLIAWLTGVGAFLFGRPFLSSAHGHPSLPLIGELPLATAALFDLGVYITVVGATMLMLSVLGSASKDGRKAVTRGGGK
ncbi:monovalent cation/H+ antiporter subunit A [Roseateles albus]|uniref:Monovalent cation/H+ antiporter subunit A n=1 Tax=Roseateles albus TaxID=2987525 RepID=A0ABT5KI38_9BURK|nr:monovalent cation/H+ antiporter subunit A [Roseateles albus]MDC8773573.1 monovalent cation/H+ antiporter subunit A [Roseateles albus]